MADKQHEDLTPADGIHAIPRRRVATPDELEALLAEWGGADDAIGSAVYVEDTRSFHLLRPVSEGPGEFVELATRDLVEPVVANRRLSQFAAATCEGTTPIQVGMLHFDAGEVLTGFAAWTFLANVGTPGAATLELVDEQTGATVATWSTTSATIEEVQLMGDVVFPNTGLYGLHLRGEGETTVAVFRGIEWNVRRAP